MDLFDSGGNLLILLILVERYGFLCFLWKRVGLLLCVLRMLDCCDSCGKLRMFVILVENCGYW